MLGQPMLALATRGAYNLHGSLLPRYRGRVPVNWAILRGEHETGATLHRMVEKPDAGAIVAQQAVPILPDDTAQEVFDKVTLAAEMLLYRALPDLVAGTAGHFEQDLSQGSYFGGRGAEDGRIDWSRPALEIHNLIRAVAPPYPGAFTDAGGRRWRVLRSLRQPQRTTRSPQAGLYCEDGRLLADCGDGAVLRLLQLELDGEPIDARRFADLFGADKISLN
jgi:methionyl-tRNA formyltransferase